MGMFDFLPEILTDGGHTLLSLILCQGHQAHGRQCTCSEDDNQHVEFGPTCCLPFQCRNIVHCLHGIRGRVSTRGGDIHASNLLGWLLVL